MGSDVVMSQVQNNMIAKILLYMLLDISKILKENIWNALVHNTVVAW